MIQDFITKLLKVEKKRVSGEISSKKGGDYENKAAFYILYYYRKITKLKFKIKQFYFNSIEDVDIIDENDRIITFQIKTNDYTWNKSDREIISFLTRNFQRYELLIKEGFPIAQLKVFFITNSMGDFFSIWENFKEEDPEKVINSFPSKVLMIVKELAFTKEQLYEIIQNITFISHLRETDLDNKNDQKIYEKFISFKEATEPRRIYDYSKDFSDSFFSELRLRYALDDKPASGPDRLVSNYLKTEIGVNSIWSSVIRENVYPAQIKEFLSEHHIFITYIFKYGRLFCLKMLDDDNPLSQFIVESKIQEHYIDSMIQWDIIQLMNDWIQKYLDYEGLSNFQEPGKSEIIFYFSKSEDWIYNFEDPYKEEASDRSMEVVSKNNDTKNGFFSNQAAKLYFTMIDNDFFLVIRPRILFSEDGKKILDGKTRTRIGAKFRKSFMKNDLLRRRMLLWRHIVVNGLNRNKRMQSQKTIDSFVNPITTNRARVVKKQFLDANLLRFMELVEFQANFKPNDENEEELESEGSGSDLFSFFESDDEL